MYSLLMLIDMDKQPKTVESYIKKAKCPLCGASLVVRTGPNGKFWGCSRYPICCYSKSARKI